jgi:DNA transformation protein
MPEPKGDKLFVNLGASQARRRLKGFGHGVRKVQSADRNQAVIIHTAYGRSLQELQARFADVGYAATEEALHEPVENLRNLGPTSAAWLREAGITTIEELRRYGAVHAFLRVAQVQEKVSLNLLWALAAGLADCDWRSLADDEKQRLRAALHRARSADHP